MKRIASFVLVLLMIVSVPGQEHLEEMRDSGRWDIKNVTHTPHRIIINAVLNKDSTLFYSITYSYKGKDIELNRTGLTYTRLSLPLNSDIGPGIRVHDDIANTEYTEMPSFSHEGDDDCSDEFMFHRDTNEVEVCEPIRKQSVFVIEATILPKFFFDSGCNEICNELNISIPPSKTDEPYFFSLTVSGGEDVFLYRPINETMCNTLFPTGKKVDNGFICQGDVEAPFGAEIYLKPSGKLIVKEWDETVPWELVLGLLLLVITVLAYRASKKSGDQAQERWERDRMDEQVKDIYAPLHTELTEMKYVIENGHAWTNFDHAITEREDLRRKPNPQTKREPRMKWDVIMRNNLRPHIPKELDRKLEQFYNDGELHRKYMALLEEVKRNKEKTKPLEEHQTKIIKRIDELIAGIEKERDR